MFITVSRGVWTSLRRRVLFWISAAILAVLAVISLLPEVVGGLFGQPDPRACELRDSTQPLRLPRPTDGRQVVVSAVALDADAPATRDAGAERGLELGEERVLIEAGLKALPRRQRRIVQLHYFANLSQRGIASELGLSQVHVSRLLHDSLGKLRHEIGQT